MKSARPREFGLNRCALIPHDDRHKHTHRALGVLHIAGSRRAAFQIANWLNTNRRKTSAASEFKCAAISRTVLVFCRLVARSIADQRSFRTLLAKGFKWVW